MTQTSSEHPIRQLILVPGLVTLAVTVLRFVGEIKQWSPNWFNHQMGLSVVAIVWLAPVFGIYFALRLRARGQQPISIWGAVGLAVLAALIVMFLPGLLPFKFAFPGRLLYGWSILVLAAAVTLPGWPALFKTMLAYAYVARIPIAILMFFAMRHNLGTHYDAVPRDLPAGIGFWPKYLWLAFFAQLVYWVATTIVMGMLFGTIAAGVARLIRGPAGAQDLHPRDPDRLVSIRVSSGPNDAAFERKSPSGGTVEGISGSSNSRSILNHQFVILNEFPATGTLTCGGLSRLLQCMLPIPPSDNP